MKFSFFLILTILFLLESCENKNHQVRLSDKDKPVVKYNQLGVIDSILTTLDRYAYGDLLKVSTSVPNGPRSRSNFRFGFVKQYFIINYSLGELPNETLWKEQIEIPIKNITGVQYNPLNTELIFFQDSDGLQAKGHEIINMSDKSRRYSSDFISIPFWVKGENGEGVENTLNRLFSQIQQ